jgi:hypothetical protein
VAKQNGGDMLGFDDDIDRIIFELDYSYVFEGLDSDTVDGAMVDAYSGLQSLVKKVSDWLSFKEWSCPGNPGTTPLGLQSSALCNTLRMNSSFRWSFLTLTI